MALLDAAIRVYGREQAELWFPIIRDLAIAIDLPELVMVNNTFVKILRPHKGGAKDVYGTGLIGPMGSTIAYREMVQFGGVLKIALQEQPSTIYSTPLQSLVQQITYLGKRGGFMQITNVVDAEDLPQGFIRLNDTEIAQFPVGGLMQIMDDCGPKMTFEQADVYSGKSIGINKPNGRILRPIVLPYRQIRASRGYTLYERMG